MMYFINGSNSETKKADEFSTAFIFVWAHSGLNQGLPDYESGALTS